MLITVTETETGNIDVSIHNAQAHATVEGLSVNDVISSFAAIVQGRKDTSAPIRLLDPEATMLWFRMNGGYATVPLSGAWQDDFSKALARVACILTDTDTEGE